MSKETIPEKIIITCDICKNIVGKEENTITLGGSSLDRGVPIGPAYMSGTKDCCFTCYNEITNLLRSLKNG